ncbi:hypothetical protein E0Z10_g802 [Xylaria hypoxylon]|uniref:Aconitase A/isopropylmalate dehydratase small subunit swivel domain-containing protein n=1 Tax=Xylaria hypoxylon TaxID=37992 RepID=A0A4Z0Z8N4_9PEZI|nr:hypothetical protein E0Z10_g802 [Xylaria hypoxylon]
MRRFTIGRALATRANPARRALLTTILTPRSWSRIRPYTNTNTNTSRQNAFQSQIEDPATASFLSPKATSQSPQPLTKKIVQKYAVGVEDALEKTIAQAEGIISSAKQGVSGSEVAEAVDGEGTLTGIIPGFPEKDGTTKEKMAAVCMENYDTEFQATAKKGDILVRGFGFGFGSSRKQAATAILAKQIPLVIAGSFSNVSSWNSINNALMSIEMPDLV